MKKLWIRLVALVIVLLLLGFASATFYLYKNQDSLVQEQLDRLNQAYHGKVSAGATHIAPFQNFPYVSIKIDEVKVIESKAENAPVLIEVADIYVGLDLMSLLQGSVQVKKLLIEEGFFKIVLYEDGSNNLSKAIGLEEEETTESETEATSMGLELDQIELRNIDLHKIDRSSGLDIQTFIYQADGKFKNDQEELVLDLGAAFELNVIKGKDTTFMKQKQMGLQTRLHLNHQSGMLSIDPSKLTMDLADFELKGTIDTQDKMNLDLELIGEKPNFDLLMAFAPSDLYPILERYENAGKIYFRAKLEGQSAFGYDPYFAVDFGASEAFLENTRFNRRIEDMGFEGHFTNGEKRNTTTMAFSMQNMTAKLEGGELIADLSLENFDSPEVEMKVNSSFDLNFIAEFLNLDDYRDASGTVDLSMNFHDIIDLDRPELTLNDLEQAYYSELSIRDLSLASDNLPAPLEQLNAHLILDGNRLELDQLEMKLGNSDLSIRGFLSDLPSLLHQRPEEISSHIEVTSRLLDLTELSAYSETDSSGINEQVEDFSLGLTFKTMAHDLMNYQHLPKGEFFIDSLHASLKHYPHELHDFHLDVLIDDTNLQLVDFRGEIDQSDFHLNGKVHDYAYWLADSLEGDLKLDFSLQSKQLRLEDLFSYQGENYVPEDYRHEEIKDLQLHFTSNLHYQAAQLEELSLELDQFGAKMLLHPMRLENFNGKLFWRDSTLRVQDFQAQLGKSKLNLDLNYYLGQDSSKKALQNELHFRSSYLDLDQLTNFQLSPAEAKTETKTKTTVPTTQDVAEHAEAYNLYTLPFPDMHFTATIDHFIYHRLDLQNIEADFRTTTNHYLYVDAFSMDVAGGSIGMKGYFNGSDPERIYVDPELRVERVDLDRIMFKFENFGQDVIVSDNLHGQLTADITGHIRIYPDFVPDLDQSELEMDILALNGRLENYDYMLMLADYFGDKDLTNVRFDTLQNHLEVKNGQLIIPNMTIESTLGHMDIAGKQNMNDSIEYYLRIPWRMIKQGAKNKVFGTKEKQTQTADEIIEVDPDEKVRYLNLKVSGTLEDFKVRPGKQKEPLN